MIAQGHRKVITTMSGRLLDFLLGITFSYVGHVLLHRAPPQEEIFLIA